MKMFIRQYVQYFVKRPPIFQFQHKIKNQFTSRVDLNVIKFKGRMHCFSTQVVVNKYFLLNPGKKKLV